MTSKCQFPRMACTWCRAVIMLRLLVVTSYKCSVLPRTWVRISCTNQSRQYRYWNRSHLIISPSVWHVSESIWIRFETCAVSHCLLCLSRRYLAGVVRLQKLIMRRRLLSLGVIYWWVSTIIMEGQSKRPGNVLTWPTIIITWPAIRQHSARWNQTCGSR